MLLNGNITDLSVRRYGDAKTLTTDNTLRQGYIAIIDTITPGVDVR